MKEILKNNKLIAEFMGDTFHTNIMIGMDHCDEAWLRNLDNEYYDSLYYHKSWDWLMPVVEKIEKTNYVKIVGNHCSINKSLHKEFNNWVCNIGMTFAPCETKLEAVHTAVIKFINWYNTKS